MIMKKCVSFLCPENVTDFHFFIKLDNYCSLQKDASQVLIKSLILDACLKMLATFYF